MDGNFSQELLSVSSANELVNIIRRDVEQKYIYYSRNITKTKLQVIKLLILC